MFSKILKIVLWAAVPLSIALLALGYFFQDAVSTFLSGWVKMLKRINYITNGLHFLRKQTEHISDTLKLCASVISIIIKTVISGV